MNLTAESIEQFLNHLGTQGMSKNTLRAYKADLVGLMTVIGDDLSETATAGYLTERRADWEPKTTQRKMAAFRRYAQHHGHRVFLIDYRAPKAAPGRAHPIKEGIDGVKRMLAVARNDRERALVALGGLGGLRVHEAIGVKAEHFILEDRILRVRGKGDVMREVPFSASLWAEVEPAYNAALGNPWATLVGLKQARARAVITELAALAQLSKTSSHQLRSTFATAAYRKSKNLRAVQNLLGHASSKTTEVYTEVSMDEMRDAGEVA